MAALGTAAISIWLWVTALLESKHLQGTWHPAQGYPAQGLSSPMRQNIAAKVDMQARAIQPKAGKEAKPEAEHLDAVHLCEGRCISMQKVWHWKLAWL